jgi:uncharacterized protein (TIGR00255 family)
MLKSMTGYGRAQQSLEGKDITVEIRSVNHRYFDFSARVPRVYGFLEEKIKSVLQSVVSRGKIDVYVGVELPKGDNVTVTLNTPLALGYFETMKQLGELLGLTGEITLEAMTKHTDIFNVKKVEEDADSIWQGVKTVLDLAAADFLEMRAREGDRLCADLYERADRIERILREIEARAPQIEEEYRQRLLQRISELTADAGIACDEGRVLTEVAIFADRISISEEIVRFYSHLAQYRSMLREDVPVGRITVNYQ